MRGARTLSTLLYIISAALIVVVIVLYFRGRDQHSDVQPTPPSVPGQNGLINVVKLDEFRDDATFTFASLSSDNDIASSCPLFVYQLPYFLQLTLSSHKVSY